jgi:hypothetical protein
LRWLVLSIAILGFLTLDLSPSTPRVSPPNAAQVMAARTTFMRVRSAAGSKEPVFLTLRWDEIAASSALLARAAKMDRIAVQRSDEVLTATASIPIFGGIWTNIGAQIAPSETGFPDISLKIGRLPIPPFVVRAGANLGRTVLGWKGLNVPPLDTLVQSLAFSNEGARAKLMIPKGSKLYDAINRAQRTPVDTLAVSEIYCSLSGLQQRVPATDFAIHVRRAFALPVKAASDVERNRAALVALAMLATLPETGNMAGDVSREVRSCHVPPGDILLLGRSDLAKHWSVSAALTATFGSDVSQAMGTWKEVADSGPAGSGFSFIDLSADRSGIAFAERASAQESASATRVRLQKIEADVLLPLAALALSEGLTEAQFQERYTNVDSSAYDEMVLRIDTILAQQNLQ